MRYAKDQCTLSGRLERQQAGNFTDCVRRDASNTTARGSANHDTAAKSICSRRHGHCPLLPTPVEALWNVTNRVSEETEW
ncbi:hypothetical protein NDU88_004590 [Pleurodeles waltl]|uniref:Uncharacterized protein n=1 Tax=Pleurodeles waltl TaxID=8319 RepID=A0AAV7QGL3_PLEWA|nr:hypothetical protein NDU88_004590 [Pleurodeles waltl]